MLKDEDFKILKTQRVFDEEKLKVDAYTVELPNGNTAVWYARPGATTLLGVPVVDESVIMVREWRLGPQKIMTSFVAGRNDLKDLKKELKEEIALSGGKFEEMIQYARGVRKGGFSKAYLVTDFELGTETEHEENELIEIIKLPIEGLFENLIQSHTCDAQTLLVAKLLEEKYG